MKWLLISLAFLVVAAALVFLFGATRPPEHTARVTWRLAAPDSAVWATVSDVTRVPEWFAEVKSVERIADIDGRPAYREQYGPGFAVTTVVRESVDRSRLVREILPSGSFSGTWTMELAAEGGATRMTITERGRVENPMFRAMMALADPRKTMRQYAAALATRLRTTATELEAR